MNPSKIIGKHFETLFNQVPMNIKLENEDLGYLLLMSICKLNGSELVGEKIMHGQTLVGDDVEYSFDGHILDFAYFSHLQKKQVKSSIKLV